MNHGVHVFRANRESLVIDWAPQDHSIWNWLFPARTVGDIQGRLRSNNFDELRIVFSGMVVLFHIAVLSQLHQFRWIMAVSSGVLAVQCFFFVSGFLVTMSCERSVTLVSYFKKRVARIAPAYVVVIVAAAILLSLISTLPLGAYFKSAGLRRYLVFNLILANFVAPDLPGVFLNSPEESAVNGSLWTIKIEVAFYCVVPVILWAARRFGGARVAGAIFVASILWFLSFTAAFKYSGEEIYLKLAKQLPGQMSYFMGGAWAYYRTRDGLPPPRLWLAAFAALAYALTDGVLHQVTAPLAVTAMVYWLAITAPSIGRFGKYGDVSYGIYLYHFPIVQIFLALGLFARAPVVSLVLIFGLVLVLAFASWHVIENPFLHRRSHAVAEMRS